MKIYPAIDILGGKAVRLKQGRKGEASIYGDPIEMAVKWVDKGADWLHVVDLDGAFEGHPKNLDLICEMATAVPDASIQVGGGIRSMETMEALLQAGIQRVVLGTVAVQNRQFVRQALAAQSHNVAVGIDARDGLVRISGWTQNASIGVVELARTLQDLGVRLIIYTDIARDGVLVGPNIDAMREMLESTDLAVIASGGVSSISDLQQLAQIDHWRLDGVIIGKALYEGRIQLEEALAHAR
jgi:phosphoribosylformimino-5-aminoimidazole carboxamide ribotide isomerase